ncbi:winged helix DNA-binding protein [Geobacter argillaceus]|uniref:Putative MarR family transcription regulator n=1 Tax=Geobacter argillaceus TaxID=345631 RepID=A0A562VN70_9BACT|nr:winged helix DNA-binding protein [Geobacter argillaceus]TWJ19345.1 putative MarR family transcription regulator [Geobacter argillaceus]
MPIDHPSAEGAQESSSGVDDTLRIVTSAHLATSYPESSEFEFGLIIAYHAFERWMIRCMNAAGAKDMAPLDILILHHINHRGKQKRLADVCFILNIEDTHLATYSIKKLVAADLVSGAKKGKEMYYSATPKGSDLCNRYKSVRDTCLIGSFTKSEDEAKTLGSIAKFLRNISGSYDQASRAASSFDLAST